MPIVTVLPSQIALTKFVVLVGFTINARLTVLSQFCELCSVIEYEPAVVKTWLPISTVWPSQIVLVIEVDLTGLTSKFKLMVESQPRLVWVVTVKLPEVLYVWFPIVTDCPWQIVLFILADFLGFTVKLRLIIESQEDEEGIGTYVEVQHLSSALVGEIVLFEATIEELEKNMINCSFIATVNERVIATGRTGQKIIKKEKLNLYFESLKKK